MLNFFYDSLETLKKVTFPTASEFVYLTIAIIIAVLLSGIFFAGIDVVVYSMMKGLYAVMTGWSSASLE